MPSVEASRRDERISSASVLLTPCTWRNMDDKAHGPRYGNGGKDVNIAVLGLRGVGKSALIVRYLTKRFIGDYDPEMEAIFSRAGVVDGKHVTVNIMDTQWHAPNNGLKEDPITWADGFLLAYSVTDPESFQFVVDLVDRLRLAREDERLPIVIAGNKCDLIHMRQLTLQECTGWAQEHNCLLCEVSASDDCDSVYEVFNILCRQVKTVHKKREKLTWIMQRPAVAAKLQIRQSLRNLAERKWRSRTSTL
ncbi:ras-related and estrogen-regulated growth inhibitor-like isoform X2 [Haliotis rubra]|uniref:ras-related and estrogen-regulated growth inhibitor-like isoform X2 n=1 Tax=Haliotis rubra TaxID=36100 RepID=UPI001EE58D13|nr:ras-related and estrogen-regulated growth inhibitor-like isoform X2 [Haliotis rubra]